MDGGERRNGGGTRFREAGSGAVTESAAYEVSEKQRQRYARYGACVPGSADGPRQQRGARHVRLQERLNEEAVRRLAATEILLTEQQGFLDPGEGRSTWQVTQEELLENLDLDAKRRALNMHLSYGPYMLDYTAGGSHMLLGGSIGTVVVMDTASLSTTTETNVEEKIRDVKFLHHSKMFAVAQKKYVHIYDNEAVELHCVREMLGATCLEFLPFHFLLVAAADRGRLLFLDISTGVMANAYKTHKMEITCMAKNPRTAVINTGHRTGTVSLWTPNSSACAAEFVAHRGAVTACAFADDGVQLLTAGVDNYVHVWDIRKLQQVRRFRPPGIFGQTPPTSLAVSQTGLVAVGAGPTVSILRDLLTPAGPETDFRYLKHTFPNYRSNALGARNRKNFMSAPAAVNSLRFKPFDDVLGVGTSGGLANLIVPGAGLANYDTRAADPYESHQTRRQREVRALLDKLPPESIRYEPAPDLDGDLIASSSEVARAKREAAEDEGDADDGRSAPRRSDYILRKKVRRRK